MKYYRNTCFSDDTHFQASMRTVSKLLRARVVRAFKPVKLSQPIVAIHPQKTIRRIPNSVAVDIKTLRWTFEYNFLLGGYRAYDKIIFTQNYCKRHNIDCKTYQSFDDLTLDMSGPAKAVDGLLDIELAQK